MRLVGRGRPVQPVRVMTKIQWTDATWNPVTGCSKVSAGCANCYAERLFPRLYKCYRCPDTGEIVRRRFTDVRTHPDRLGQPLRWRKPRRVFVCSMGDLFHEAVPDEFIVRVFSVMCQVTAHTFQVLTKRPERMRDFVAARYMTHAGSATLKPLPNVWLGVSAEDQATADERIPLLLQTPAAVRFLSCEPLLGRVVLQGEWLARVVCDGCGGSPMSLRVGDTHEILHNTEDRFPELCGRGIEPPALDWIIVGGESGPKARPCSLRWLRSIVGQCRATGVPCFVKQLGAKAGVPSCASFEHPDCEVGWLTLKDRKGGDMAEWPADLRVREYPNVRETAGGGWRTR